MKVNVRRCKHTCIDCAPVNATWRTAGEWPVVGLAGMLCIPWYTRLDSQVNVRMLYITNEASTCSSGTIYPDESQHRNAVNTKLSGRQIDRCFHSDVNDISIENALSLQTLIIDYWEVENEELYVHQCHAAENITKTKCPVCFTVTVT